MKKNFTHYTTQELEDNAFKSFLEKRQFNKQKIFMKEVVLADPIKRVFSAQKAILSRQKNSGKSNISLPKLKFLENTDG
jgi:hypothetical protein